MLIDLNTDNRWDDCAEDMSCRVKILLHVGGRATPLVCTATHLYLDRQMIRLMAEILHQLISSLSNYSIYRVLYIPGGTGFRPSTVPGQKRGIFDVFACMTPKNLGVG